MAEKIQVRCPECEAKLAVPASAAGKKIRCPKCQGVVPVGVQVQTPEQTPPSAAGNKTPGRKKPVVSKEQTQTRARRKKKRAAVTAKPQPKRQKKAPPRRPAEVYDDYELYDDVEELDDDYGDSYLDEPYADDFYDEPPQRSGRQMPPRARKKPKAKGRSGSSKGGGGWFSSYEGQRVRSIVGSLVVTIAGVAWLGLGLANGVLYFYPIFLIIGGLAGAFRAALSD